MMKVIKFYFDIIASFFTDIMQSWEIFPGIGYGVYFVALIVFLTCLSFFVSAVKRELNNEAYKIVDAKRKELQYNYYRHKRHKGSG